MHTLKKENIDEFITTLKIYILIVVMFIADYFITSYNFLACPLYKVIGVPCPVCGSSRATFSLLELDINKALMYNPSIFFIYSVIILFLFNKLYKNKKLNYLIVTMCIFIFVIYIFNILMNYPDGEVMNYNSDSYLQKLINFIKK